MGYRIVTKDRDGTLGDLGPGQWATDGDSLWLKVETGAVRVTVAGAVTGILEDEFAKTYATAPAKRLPSGTVIEITVG